MATVNKDFKIKNGLVVEGTTATINGNNILRESASDQYILDLIGGETLVKSVDTFAFTVDGSGQLQFNTADVIDDYLGFGNELSYSAGTISINRSVTDTWYDAYGSASQAVTDSATYTDGRLNYYTQTSDLDTTIYGYGYLKSADLPTPYGDTDVDAHLSGGNGITYSSGTISANVGNGITTENINAVPHIVVDRTTVDAWYDAAGSASAAQSNAQDYADNKINDGSTATDKAWSAYKTSTEIGLAQAAAELHADNAVAALVDSAPALLDTLNELAAAIGDDANFASSIGTSIGEKVAKSGDTMTGELVLFGSPTQGNAAATKTYVDLAASGAYNDAIATAADDATTKANTAEQDAKDYADAGLNTKADASNPTLTGTLTLDGSGDFTITSDSSIVLLSTVDSYIGSATPGNEIATEQYVDDAIAGVTVDYSAMAGTYLDWNGAQFNVDASGIISDNDLASESYVSSNFVSQGGLDGAVSGLGYAKTVDVPTSTDDLTEGTAQFFTNQRALDAISNAPSISPQAVYVNSYRKEETTQQGVPNASTVYVHAFDYPFESAKYLVRVVGWVNGVKHSQLTEILMTIDGNSNIAITEYGTVCTDNSNLASFSATYDNTNVAGSYILTATTAVGGCEIIAAATMLSWAD